MSCYQFGVLVTLAAFTCLSGCDSAPETAEVTGTVTYDGQPLKSGTIIFEAEGQRPAHGKIVDGKIVEVTTFKANDGAPIGSHKVAIQATGEAAGSAEAADPSASLTSPNYMGGGKSLIPSTYGNPATSGLTAEIKEGTNPVTFELVKNPGK